MYAEEFLENVFRNQPFPGANFYRAVHENGKYWMKAIIFRIVEITII